MLDKQVEEVKQRAEEDAIAYAELETKEDAEQEAKEYAEQEAKEAYEETRCRRSAGRKHGESTMKRKRAKAMLKGHVRRTWPTARRNRAIYEQLRDDKMSAIELARKYKITRGRIYQIYDSEVLKELVLSGQAHPQRRKRIEPKAAPKRNDLDMIKTDKGLVGKYMRCGMLSGRVVEMITPEWYLIRLEQWRELEGAKFPTEIVSLAELTECDEKGFRNYYFFDTREELSAFVQHIEGFKDADDGPEIAPFA